MTHEPESGQEFGISGIFIPNPDYNQSASDRRDIAVVLLDDEPGITPADMPPEGALDLSESMHMLRGQTFTAVGYVYRLDTESARAFLGQYVKLP